MSTTNTPYDLFLSYSRKDDLPIGSAHSIGWVTALAQHIVQDHRAYSTELFRVFFDTNEIRDMDDWRHRILGGLRQSKILLVCLSPSYFASEYCRWEWDEYLKRQVHQCMGSDSIASVYFVEVPGRHEQANAKWLDLVQRGNFTDLRPWFQEGATALQVEEVRRRMKRLGASLYDRISRARRAEQAPGNLARQNPYFVGRGKELRDLHARLGVGTVGVVTAVHGLGGIGKTELVISYAHAFADCYPVGLWELEAEGKADLLALIGELAFVRALGFTPTEAEKNDPALLGRAVLSHLNQRAEVLRGADPSQSAATLLILDNVSEARLLSPSQLATLPQSDWLRIVATTRLGHESFRVHPRALALLEVDVLTEEDALELVREHQPEQQFPTSSVEAAARELVRELGGFTLAIEQVAIHLGLSGVAPSVFLANLRRKGLQSADVLPDKNADIADQMRHQEKQLSVILDAALSRLTESACTVLRFAALLPPDSVPWPWLRELTIARHPELAVGHDPDEPDPWQEIVRRLRGLRLLTQADQSEMARMHRLVAAHLRSASDEEARAEFEKHAARRAEDIYRSQAAPQGWELDALLVALPYLLADQPNGDLACHSLYCFDKIVTYRSLNAAASLLRDVYPVLSLQAASNLDNAEWQCVLSIALEKLGDVAVSQGELPAAVRRFVESHEIISRLAASDPDNAEWQRDLCRSLGKLGNLAVAQGELPVAAWRFGESIEITKRLVTSNPDNARWQRDLWVSCWNMASLLEKQELPEAQAYWLTAYDTLVGMKRAGLFVSPRDEEFLAGLRDKFGK